MTLAAENANSKLVDAVAIADVDVDDVKERVNNRLTTANSLAAACFGSYYVRSTQLSGPLCVWQCSGWQKLAGFR